jgi:hypothetical protein
LLLPGVPPQARLALKGNAGQLHFVEPALRFLFQSSNARDRLAGTSGT